MHPAMQRIKVTNIRNKKKKLCSMMKKNKAIAKNKKRFKKPLKNLHIHPKWPW